MDHEKIFDCTLVLSLLPICSFVGIDDHNFMFVIDGLHNQKRVCS